MTRQDRPYRTAERRDDVVQRPRVTDAIGLALRGAYGSVPGLPADMASALRRLDGVATRFH